MSTRAANTLKMRPLCTCVTYIKEMVVVVVLSNTIRYVVDKRDDRDDVKFSE